MAATPEQAPAKVEKPMNPLAKLYVILYNAACCAGWALLLFKVVSFLQANKWTFGDSAALYKDIEQPLKLVQTAAILEIVHAATGLVRSNVMTAFMQVLSRVGILWAVVHLAPAAQKSWAFSLMALSWSLVEVPRYLFYVCKEVFGTVPGWLNWLRYSLFMVLYPSGITGEVLCLLSSLPFVLEKKVWTFTLPNQWNIVYNHYLVLLLVLLIYVPGSPYMFSHMWVQRKKALGPKTAAEEAKDKTA